MKIEMKVGLKEILIVAGGVWLIRQASRFFSNRSRSRSRSQNNDFDQKGCCFTCRAERERRARSLISRPFQVDEHEQVDASIALHPCNHQVVMTLNAPPDFQLSLDLLPCFLGTATQEDPFGDGWVLGSSNGLLLCSTHKLHTRQWGPTLYYLCDPFNKQWIALPPTPKSMCVNYLGFVFDPCTNFGNPDLHQPLPCSEACRFMVLRIPMMSSQFEVEIFSSDVGQWSRASLPSPHQPLLQVGSLFHNGCLHWLSRGSCVVYDPYNNKLRGLIPPPPKLQLCQVSPLHGPVLSRGSIWLLQHCQPSLLFRFWELKGYDFDTNGQFDLDKCYWSPHRLCDLTEILGDSTSQPCGLAIHPHDPDVVYLKFFRYDNHNRGQFNFVSCNLRTKVMGQPMLVLADFKVYDGIILVHQPHFKSSFSSPSSLTTSLPLI